MTPGCYDIEELKTQLTTIMTAAGFTGIVI